jgi:hypothetical protein
MLLESSLDGWYRIILPMCTVPREGLKCLKETLTKGTQRLLVNTSRIGYSTKLVTRFLDETYLTNRVGVVSDICITQVIDIDSFFDHIKGRAKEGPKIPTNPGVSSIGYCAFQ